MPITNQSVPMLAIIRIHSICVYKDLSSAVRDMEDYTPNDKGYQVLIEL